MTSSAAKTRIAADNLCAVGASERHEDPIGSGYHIARALAIEVPTPWGASFYESDPEGTLRQRTAAMVTANYERLRDNPPPEGAGANGYTALFAIAPDPEYSDPTTTKALLITRATGSLSRFEIAEYEFPFESMSVLDLVATFLGDEQDYANIAAYRVPHGGRRELFVCTHGQVDICCGKFGFPLYAEARQMEGARVWRASHFGGHRYAPTAWEMPSGYMWGFLDDESTRNVMSRTGDPNRLGAKMRGTGGFPGPVQVLDRVGFEAFGWAWMDFERSGSAEQVSEDERRWRVQIAYTTPDGAEGQFEGTVEVGRDLPLLSCGTASQESNYTVPEYRLISVRHDRT